MFPHSQCNNTKQLSIGQLATLACLLEVAAPKPGNVHRGADFEDLTLQDFLVSAVAIEPALQQASSFGIGQTVLYAVEATQHLVHTNTNLGILLLLAPLCCIPRNESLQDKISEILIGLKPKDSAKIYRAIQLANPGGLGAVEQHDINQQAPENLLEAMKEAEQRDLIAYQYTQQFQTVFQAADWLTNPQLTDLPLSSRIVHVHVQLMSEYPDSLIARKCGKEVAINSSVLAKRVIESGAPFSELYHQHLVELDFWLRSDHHLRNPGTTADLVAAALFVALRDNRIDPPFR